MGSCLYQWATCLTNVSAWQPIWLRSGIRQNLWEDWCIKTPGGLIRFRDFSLFLFYVYLGCIKNKEHVYHQWGVKAFNSGNISELCFVIWCSRTCISSVPKYSPISQFGTWLEQRKITICYTIKPFWYRIMIIRYTKKRESKSPFLEL